MRSEDLAEYVEKFVKEAVGDDLSPLQESIMEAAKDRIMGVGHDQYSDGDKQKFEVVSIDKLLAWAEEETIDQINYGVMPLIRIRFDEDLDISEDRRELLENDCLDVIEQGVMMTSRIRSIRGRLARATSH